MQKINGSCLCGEITYEAENAFEKLFLCSCVQCRQITGSAFASNLFVTADAFAWLSGVDTIATYQLPGRDISKSFCRVCGSGVPWPTSDGSKMVVPAGSLNQEPNIAERVKIFVSERTFWSTGLEQISGHDAFPPD